jgi:Fic family protein
MARLGMSIAPKYIHKQPDWPNFQWDHEALAGRLSKAKVEQARLLGRMESLGFELRQDAVLKTITADVIKSSEIEGEILNPDQVRSSVARRLGMDIAGVVNVDRYIDGVVEMMMDATSKYNEPLTSDRLFGWHAALFPTGRSGMRKIRTGAYRDDAEGPMQIISGAVGKERVHFEAPEATKIAREMDAFLTWFNSDRSESDWIVTAALAHLWFVTIHPFEDGNGRIARAISDMSLARSEKSSQRFYSLSSQIRQERAAYYEILEATQKRTANVTPWLDWFIGCTSRAIESAQSTLANVFAKGIFWNSFSKVNVNERQRLMLNRLFDGFEGKLTTEKWQKVTKSSQRTAVRDIQDLVEKGALVQNPEGGRSTSYRLAEIKA